MKRTPSPINSDISKRNRYGFTLLEIVTSLTIMSVLIVAMGSAMIVVSRGMPDPDAPLAENLSAVRMIDQIASELQYATTIISATKTSIEFIVERNGVPVTINYSWSGLSGDPLTRQYDGGTVIYIIPSIADFNLNYNIGATPSYTTPSTEGAETILIKYAPGAYSGHDYKISSSNWPGQYFKPSLPVGAESWRVTQVAVRAMSDGSNSGLTLVQIRTVDAGDVPSSTVIEQIVMNEADLSSSYRWERYAFSNVGNIAPGDGLFLVLKWVQDAKSAAVEYVSDPSGFASTSNSGGNWNVYSGVSLLYYVYGKVTMPGVDVFPICSVNIGIDTGSVGTPQLQTSALLLNQPATP